MELDPIDAIIQKLNDEFWKLAATKEEQHHQNALALLDDLASRHIYFQQFRLDMNCRLTHAKLFNSYTEDVLPRAYLYHLPEKLRQMQAQILELIIHALDTEGVRGNGTAENGLLLQGSRRPCLSVLCAAGWL